MQFEVNVFGQVAVTRALLPALRAARGRIVLLSSIGGLVSVPFNGPYAASKHAIEALGDALRGELHSSHIDVSLVEPGSVKTPIWGKAQDTASALEVPPELQQEYGRVPAAFAKVLADTRASRGLAGAGRRDDRAGAHGAPSARPLSRRARRSRDGPRPRVAADACLRSRAAARARGSERAHARRLGAPATVVAGLDMGERTTSTARVRRLRFLPGGRPVPAPAFEHVPAPPSERGHWLLAGTIAALGVAVLVAVLTGLVGRSANAPLAPPTVLVAAATPAPAPVGSAVGVGARTSSPAPPARRSSRVRPRRRSR